MLYLQDRCSSVVSSALGKKADAFLLIQLNHYFLAFPVFFYYIHRLFFVIQHADPEYFRCYLLVCSTALVY